MAKKAVCDNCKSEADMTASRPGVDIPDTWFHVRTRGYEIERDYCSINCAKIGVAGLEQKDASIDDPRR